MQVRAFGEAALETLLKSGASAKGPPSESRDTEGQKKDALSVLLVLLPEELRDTSSPANGPFIPKYSLLTRSLEFQGTLVADLLNARQFSDVEAWNRSISLFMKGWMDSEHSKRFAEAVRKHFLAIDQVFHFFNFSYDMLNGLIAGKIYGCYYERQRGRRSFM